MLIVTSLRWGTCFPAVHGRMVWLARDSLLGTENDSGARGVLGAGLAARQVVAGGREGPPQLVHAVQRAHQRALVALQRLPAARNLPLHADNRRLALPRGRHAFRVCKM